MAKFINVNDIREKILQDLGYNFTGYCDTEVILKGFIHYGTDIVKKN